MIGHGDKGMSGAEKENMEQSGYAVQLSLVPQGKRFRTPLRFTVPKNIWVNKVGAHSGIFPLSDMACHVLGKSVIPKGSLLCFQIMSGCCKEGWTEPCAPMHVIGHDTAMD
ncbi:MAG: hypothetical protein EA399_16010 [Desulfovibrionales bacterium]|nr:MAG: hypothetical protein EA399_16010 [Desulfovibrionales bacterium]